jgi:hypothetical protein
MWKIIRIKQASPLIGIYSLGGRRRSMVVTYNNKEKRKPSDALKSDKGKESLCFNLFKPPKFGSDFFYFTEVETEWSNKK